MGHKAKPLVLLLQAIGRQNPPRGPHHRDDHQYPRQHHRA
jgi:hypothetical protein